MVGNLYLDTLLSSLRLTMNKFSTIGKTLHSNHWRTTAQKKKNTLGQWDEAGKKPKLASRENVNGSLRQN